MGLNCQKLDCKLKHLEKPMKECQFYSNGYCKEGKNCKLAHKKKELCLNYLIGFCPEGPECQNFHLKTLISPSQDNMNYLLKK